MPVIELPNWLMLVLALCLALLIGYLIVARRIFQVSENQQLKQELEELRGLNDGLMQLATHFEEVSAAANDGIYRWDFTKESWTANEAGLQILGDASAEGVTTNEGLINWWNNHIHPDDLASYQQSVEAALTAQSHFWSHEYRFKTPSGQYAHILDRAYYSYDDQGNPIHFTGVLTNLTDIVETKDALQDSVVRFRNLLNNVPGVIFRVQADDDYTVEFMSKRRILGYRANKFVDHPVANFYEHVHASDRHELESKIHNSIHNNVPVAVNFRAYHKDNSIHWYSLQGSTVADGEGIVHLDGVAIDITRSMELANELRYQAAHDSLTGLINRREFEKQLSRTIHQAQTPGTQHVLFYMDLDQFKVINDTCGHIAGDELLRQLSADMSQLIGNEILARLGGDEFGLLLKNRTLSEAKQLAQELRNVVRSFRFNWEGKEYSLGISQGIVEITDKTISAYSALSMADTACYMSKEQGGGRIQVYSESEIEVHRRQSEMEWVGRIQKGINENQFELYYQPIVPAAGKSPCKFCELLVRLNHEGEVINPGAFIPAAERFKISPQIDRWVFNEACNWIEETPNHKLWDTYSINLSGISLSDDDLLSFIVERVSQPHFEAPRLCFEITETAAITNLVKAQHFIKTLSELGCYFAIDDFGSGLCSFSYLKSLPVHYLKIDGSFVKDLKKDSVNYQMVKSINDIGQVMGKKTIAEFVEDQETLDLLNELGLDMVQGFYLGKPQPLSKFLAMQSSQTS